MRQTYKRQLHIKEVRFKNPDGLTLCGEICSPEGSICGTVILTHPHPLYGGEMRNNVVGSLWRALPQDGLLALRFNFRGVGASEGSFENGIGEARDLRGAIRFVEESEDSYFPIFLIGYSFGASVIHLTGPLPPIVKGIVMISPPVSMRAFERKRFGFRPTLFIAGDRDPFCRPEDLKKLVSTLKGDNTLKIIAGADHFWYRMEKPLIEVICPWIISLIGNVP